MVQRLQTALLIVLFVSILCGLLAFGAILSGVCC